jgi:DNA polymerase III delta subunit
MRVKFYEFVDKQPKIGTLVIIEGTEQVLAERALELLLDRMLPADVRELNLQRFAASEIDDAARVREAVQAMPFLADRRVVVVTDAQTMKAQPRRDLWDVAQSVPDGSTLVIADLLPPRSTRPQPFGALAGRSALRIDTTANEDTRLRFVEELLGTLDATAEPRVKSELARSEADLASVRNDLEKLSLSGKKITFKELEQESVSIEDPKAYRYASALLEGKTAEAFEIAHDFFESDPRGAAIPLLSALATECGLLWELARDGGSLPARLRWRERVLRPLAARIGERRARAAYERAVRGVEAVVTGSAGSDPGDHRTLVERISAELSALGRR